MAYEKLLNEIYAALSLQYLWPGCEPGFVKHESPDWINEAMGFGLEVSQALLPDDGQAARFIESYLGCRREEIPASAFARYGDRLHFYNDRFWAILPDDTHGHDDAYKVCYRFDRKLEKLNAKYRKMERNGLYLFVHPRPGAAVQPEHWFNYMRERQSGQAVRFDWVFLNCGEEIFVCDFAAEAIAPIRLPENAATFLSQEAERLRYDAIWLNGTPLE